MKPINFHFSLLVRRVLARACVGIETRPSAGYTDDDKMFVYLLFLPFSDEYLLIENTYISLEEMLFEMD